MNILQHQYYTNKTYKSTISKDTTCKSSRNDSNSKADFEGIVKSKAFETKFPHQPQGYLKSIRKTMILFPQYKQNQLSNATKKSILEVINPIDQQVWKFTMTILARFHFNYETIALGLSFYLKLTFKNHSIDKRPQYLKKFHISGCIYLAAKSIQVETKIPKPSDYQYFCGQNFTSQDYNKFQRFLILQLEYDLQKSTLFTFLNFYLSIGVFYKAQIFESDKEISELENEILQKGLQSLKKCLFLENECGNPEYEAIRIIRETRKKYNLTEECKIFHSFSSKNNYQAQSKRLSYSSFSNSMGNLLHFSRDSKFYTQKQITEASTSSQRQHQKVVFLSKNKSPLNNNLGTISGSCIIKRKPNTIKNSTKKGVFEGHQDSKVEGFRYVAIKDRKGLDCEEDIVRRQLIKCKSVSFVGSVLINGTIKYQRSKFKQNSQITTFQSNTLETTTTSSIDPKIISSSLLKSSKSLQYFNQIPHTKHTRKLSKLQEQNEDRMIQKSRSRSKSHQDSNLKEQQNLITHNRTKYFHRKNKCNKNQLKNKRLDQSTL